MCRAGFSSCIASAPEVDRVGAMFRPLLIGVVALSMLSCALVATPTAERQGGQGSTLGFDRTNWDILFSDPEAYKDARVEIVGLVFIAPERDENGVIWQMYADPQEHEWNTIVKFAAPDFSVKADDYVRVRGTVMGAFEGTNLFGGKVRAVAVAAESAIVVDALAAAPSAIRVYQGRPDILKQHGLEISLDKVEFAETETRVFLTVVNDSDAEASFYSFNAKAVQGKRQFDADSGIFKDYPKVQSGLLPSTESSGVVVFPAMDPSMDTHLHFEARNDNYRLDFGSYLFRVPAD